jgi:hypothetical protein
MSLIKTCIVVIRLRSRQAAGLRSGERTHVRDRIYTHECTTQALFLVDFDMWQITNGLDLCSPPPQGDKETKTEASFERDNCAPPKRETRTRAAREKRNGLASILTLPHRSKRAPNTSGLLGNAPVVVPRCPRCHPRRRPLPTRIPCRCNNCKIKKRQMKHLKQVFENLQKRLRNI